MLTVCWKSSSEWEKKKHWLDTKGHELTKEGRWKRIRGYHFITYLIRVASGRTSSLIGRTSDSTRDRDRDSHQARHGHCISKKPLNKDYLYESVSQLRYT